MKQQDIQELAREAIDVAVRHIQDRLGIKTGDLAGLYFQGDTYEIPLSILEAYIQVEIQEGSADGVAVAIPGEQRAES